ncbi:MAG: nucleoside monophosphate kinase [Snowella sp.]|nr:nucleoside monophosphate kinase [Snowella sp.]
MRLVLLGGPGAGKGTQSHRLSQRLQVPGISTGNILRQAIASQDALGMEAEPYLKKGELLPDPMMINFIRSRLVQPDMERGWILEGYPRTAFQAEELDFLLEDLQQPLTCVIYLKIEEKVMIERSLTRSLVDDQLDVIQKRIDSFQEKIALLLDYYTGKKKLITLSAEDTPENIEMLILKQINF